MKILTLITSIDKTKGGPSRSVPVFVRGLAQEGVDITLMTIESDNMNLHILDGTTAKIHLLPPNYKRRDLEKFILREKFDIIHGQGIWELLFHWMRVIADKHRIPYILTPRGTLEPWSLQQKKWKKQIARWLYQDKDLKRSVCIYATAETELSNIRKLGFKNPLCVIPNGIETDNYPCRTNPSVVKKQILFLSRLHPKKGIEVLIDAFARLQQDFPDWNVLIVGNGEDDYVETLQAKVTQLKVENKVKISPPVFGKGKATLYQESSLFCLPSYSENFGMVIAEAMSCGVPAITTVETPWELLNGNTTSMGASLQSLGENKQTGWCIDTGVDALAHTLREAMALPPHILYEMGQKGSKLINENFNYRNIAKKNKELYEWILKKKDKPSFVTEE